MAGKKRVGIVLFQLGGPDSLDAVEPFLLQSLSRSRHYPARSALGPAAHTIAKLISSRRSKPVLGRYAQIGRRSPIGMLTERQRARLLRALSPYVDPVAVTAMRYWNPTTTETPSQRSKNSDPLDELVLLPLYPHYSYATTLSSLKEWRRVADAAKWNAANGAPPERVVEHFYNHPLVHPGLVENIGTSCASSRTARAFT